MILFGPQRYHKTFTSVALIYIFILLLHYIANAVLHRGMLLQLLITWTADHTALPSR